MAAISVLPADHGGPRIDFDLPAGRWCSIGRGRTKANHIGLSAPYLHDFEELLSGDVSRLPASAMILEAIQLPSGMAAVAIRTKSSRPQDWALSVSTDPAGWVIAPQGRAGLLVTSSAQARFHIVPVGLAAQPPQTLFRVAIGIENKAAPVGLRTEHDPRRVAYQNTKDYLVRELARPGENLALATNLAVLCLCDGIRGKERWIHAALEPFGWTGGRDPHMKYAWIKGKLQTLIAEAPMGCFTELNEFLGSHYQQSAQGADAAIRLAKQFWKLLPDDAKARAAAAKPGM
jgi:hypothetical protein